MSQTHQLNDNVKKQIQVDIIVLGCSLSGMVTAHKLKKTFGDTMEIIVLDLANKPKYSVKQDDVDVDGVYNVCDETARDVIDNITKYHLTVYANMFLVPIPKSVIVPKLYRSNFKKVFENQNGNIETYDTNTHEFNFLNVFEQFELNQYEIALDVNMKDLFQANQTCEAAKRKVLRYLDRTSMEQDICRSLLFPSSRNIMRSTVNLVCGISPSEVSVLFFLYQCYRTGSVTNNLDGSNTKLHVKLLKHFKKHLFRKLYQSIFNIMLSVKPIKEIGSFSDEKVILKTLQGDTNYVCNHLAVALKPDEIYNIQFESTLLTENEKNILTSMTKGRSKKCWIQYKENFWRRAGYSGDILSLRGPIFWATEQPKQPHTARKDVHPTLAGYLQCKGGDTRNSEEAVKQQLMDLFGEEAARPIRYEESEIHDIYAPRCGNFLPLRRLIDSSNKIEWGALDIFADGDLVAALEAGHNAYMHLVAYLRPQAQTYEDLVVSNLPTFFNDTSPFRRWFSAVNFVSSTRVALYATVVYVGYRFLRYLNS